MSESRFDGVRRVIRFRRPVSRHAAMDVTDEIRFHLDLRTDELVAGGLEAGEARAQAVAEFGNPDGAARTMRRSSRHTQRRIRVLERLNGARRDLGRSVRGLSRSPALTGTILATVGLGIGATTVMFALVSAVVIRPLPYSDADQLVRIYTDSPPNRWPFSVVDYQALDTQQTRFAQIAGYTNRTLTFADANIAERVPAKVVTWGYFSLLGIQPAIGRTFSESDAIPGKGSTAVVSHRFWRRHLREREALIGSAITLDGRETTVVGVLPPSPGPLELDRDVFVVAQFEAPERRGPFFIRVLARLDPNSGRTAADQELRVLNDRLFPEWQDTFDNEDASWAMVDLKAMIVGNANRALMIVLAAVAMVLLIASVNAASLLLARNAQRGRELAIRAALGASRGRLLQHLWAESALLAMGGAGLGLAVAVAGTELVSKLGVGYLPRAAEMTFDRPAVLFLLFVTAASGVLFGFLPSLHATRFRFEDSLRSGGRSGTAAPASRRFRRGLVVAQFAIAAPVLVGAGLLVSSLWRLQDVDPGFDDEHLLTFGISLPAARYTDGTAVLAFWEAARESLVSIPGVTSAGLANGRPPNRYPMSNNFELVDRPLAPGAAPPSVPWISATPEYFQTLGVPLLEGRLYDDRDVGEDSPPVLVVDRTWADVYFPGESPIGRQLIEGGCAPPECPLSTVIGVVGDAKYTGLDTPSLGTVYWPAWITLSSTQHAGYLYLRTTGPPLSVLPAVRRELGAIDSALPVSDIATGDDLLAGALDAPRYLALVVGGFAGVALLLSLVGIYGIMANFVQTGMKDIGIRLALGAGPRMELRRVVGRGMRLVVVGVGLGTVVAWLLTRFMEGLLYGVAPADIQVFSAVTMIMLLGAATACFVPARRAASVNPARTLRED